MLTLKNICVRYSYKTVLKDVSLSFDRGKIYSLLGENGAGKSTLAHVICGDLKPTAGKLFINEEEVSFKTPHAAINRGIVCVHQRPLLAPGISVFENLKLGQKDFDKDRAEKILNPWIPEIKKSFLVKNLTEEQRFFVSLTGALLRFPKLLILDEPPFIKEEKLRTLTIEGISIIMITHNLKEALEKSDEVILLQDGNVLEKKPTENYTEEEIKQKLFGISKEVKIPSFIQKENITEEEVLKMRAKKTEVRAGYIPSDKTFSASNPELTILQLCTAYHTDKKSEDEEKFTKEILEKAQVEIKPYEKARNLSGGMLQRIILEREIMEKPRVLYLFNPTKGLDVESTERLYKKLKTLHEEGTRIVLSEAN